MSNFPSDFDDDTTLPFVNNNLTEIGAEAINSVRDAVFNIEQYLGLGGAGTTSSISSRIGISLNPDGTIKPSAIASLGLVTLPITNNQISSSAEIQESKLRLDYRTSDLFNYIKDLSIDMNTALGWISASGSKLEPHLYGFAFRHILSQLDVTNIAALEFKNKFRQFRDNTNAFTSINDLNNELLFHQFADGSPAVTPSPIITNDGSSYPATHAHTSSGIYLNTSRFATIPQTATDLQQFAEYIDSASIFLLGTRIQNLYSNGISKESRSSRLTKDGYGQEIVSSTNVITYLLNTGNSTSPVDDINNGDDIIEFKPSSVDMSSNSFDAKFSLVKTGDIIRVNYDGVEISHIVKEKKYIQSGGNKKYIIRIESKNLKYSTTATARIDKPLVNLNKYGVLSVSAANNDFSEKPSLIVGTPRGAMASGIGFNPDLFDSSHYVLYLAVYPTGNPSDGYTILPGIDVTGNSGATPGQYTLESVIESTNNAFRKNGYNYRFVAYQHQGEFGIALADSYNNVSFSILSGVLDANGSYNQNATDIAFPNNVVGLFGSGNLKAPDPLGFGIAGANIASPPYASTYSTADQAQLPTKLFIPLRRNNFYVNGVEIEKFGLEINQVEDTYGDGYWFATVQNKNVFPGAPPIGRVQTTYRIPLDLSTSNLEVGKTVVIQSLGSQPIVNFGRFIIESINCSCGANDYTDIVVYDAVHGTAVSPSNTLDVGSSVALYFCSDSVTFNSESATDFNNVSPFKRHFEVLIDQNAKTFTHERARINASAATLTINGSVPLYTYSELNKLNIIKVSPKLRGYQFGTVNKITLKITELTSSGSFTGYLCKYDGVLFTNSGPITTGNIGSLTRFYDETNIDYIDIIFDNNTVVSAFNNQIIDFQLFPTLSLDNQVMLLATCQFNDVTKKISSLRDERQFGNVSEKDLTTSAINFISSGEKFLHGNGVIRGFDLENTGANPSSNQIYMTGGMALVNGKFIQINSQTVAIPIIQETYLANIYNINWALCVNDKGEYQPIPLLDYDSSINNANNADRLFRAYNPVNGVSYVLEASTFSNIINNKKNLTILYIISSVVTPPAGANPVSIALSITDARRYVTDVDNNLSLKLTSGNSQGNFKNPEAIINWIKFNNSYNSVAIVKGADATTGVITNPLNLNFSSNVTIDGLNNALLTMNAPVTIGSNITFKNLNIVFENGVSFASGASDVVFENCNITVSNTLTAAAPTNNIIFDIANGSDIKIKDCTFDINYHILSTGGAAFRLTNVNKFSVEDSNIQVNFNIDPSGSILPGDMFIIKNSPGILMTGSVFEGNFKQFIRNTSSNDMTIKDSYVYSSFNPNSSISPDVFDATTDPLSIEDGLPVITYDPTNLVNSGRGFIYSQVSSTLNNIIIDNVNFTYMPDPVSLDRFSFINFELSTNTSILSNVTINNCKFNHSTSTAWEVRSAIAIINTAAAVVDTQPQPLLKNVNIKNNYCSKNQSIIVTSRSTDSDTMVYPGLVPEKCVIENNTCGSIGYWVASSSRTIDTFPSITSLSAKDSSLIISGNDCHVINSVNHKGLYFLPSKIVLGISESMCSYPSGNVIIENNVCNWIHTGISFEEHSSLKILNNTLSAYDPFFLAINGNTLVNSIAPAYAIFVLSNTKVIPTVQSPGEGSDSACIISGNTTSAGYWLQSNSVKFIYNYLQGYICCTSSSTITNNILKGVWNNPIGAFVSALVIVGGVSNIVTNNKIYRQGNTINSYVYFNNLNIPFWDGTGSYGLVVDNFLDSPYTLGSSTTGSNEWISDWSIPKHWTVERNINQTAFAMIGITSNVYSGNWFGFSSSYNSNFYIAPMTSQPGGQFDRYRSLVLHIHDNVHPPQLRFWGWQEDLSRFLPHNAKILSLQMGVRTMRANPVQVLDTSIVTDAFKLSLNRYTDYSKMPTSKSGTAYTNLNYILPLPSNDTKVINPPLNAIISASLLNGYNSTQYLNINLETIDPSTGESNGTTNVVNDFIINNKSPITVALDVDLLKVNNAAVELDLLVSPLSVKYRW
jgi:hypothetical protein